VDEAWKQLPRAAVIVCASVLASPSARAQEPEANTEPDSSSQPTDAPGPIAPTCGEACHGGGEVYEEPRPPPEEIDKTAPTCGKACHGGGDDSYYSDVVAPPPVDPASKPGCAVEDADDASPLALAALGLGLIGGAASRRRRDRDESKS
jgi:MYXO-CTERM domain-containing protein